MRKFLKRILELLERNPPSNTLDVGGTLSAPTSLDNSPNIQFEGQQAAKPDLSIFGKLPPELILHTVTFLPISSAALFALCSHSTLAIVGVRYWSALTEPSTLEYSDNELFSFLYLLAHDLPDYVPCYFCMCLHHYPLNDSTLTLWKCLKPCHTHNVVGSVYIYIHRCFDYNLFQKVMKSYRLGASQQVQFGIKLLTWNSAIRNNIRSGFAIQCQYHAKIINGSFLLRMRRWIFIRPNQTFQDLSRTWFPVCSHFNNVGKDIPYPNVEMKFGTNYGLQACSVCATEWEVTVSDGGDAGAVVTVTKWMDLGEGRFIWDSKWHLPLSPRYMGKRQYSTFSVPVPVREVAGATYSAFEGKEYILTEPPQFSEDRLAELLDIVLRINITP